MFHQMCASMYFPEFISNLSREQILEDPIECMVDGRRRGPGGSLSLVFLCLSVSCLLLSFFVVCLCPCGWGERRGCGLMTSEREPNRERMRGNKSKITDHGGLEPQ